MADLIERQEAIECLSNLRCGANCFDEEERSQYTALSHAIAEIELLPSAQIETDGFCTDCKEYDSERHFCPRFDRVIKRTVEEMRIIHCKDCSNWIPGYITDQDDFIPPKCGKYQQMVGHSSDDYCSLAERREE